MRKRGASYKGKGRVDPLAAFRSAGRQHKLDGSQKLRLGVVLRTHLQALATGKADEPTWHNLAGAINTSMVLAEDMEHVEGLYEAVGAAQAAVLQLRENGRQRGRWLVDGEGLTALKHWLDYYEAQLESVSQQEAMNAIDEVGRRVARGQVF